ncbi:hypothetical protein F5I97DRAFT_1806123 [Phlebopus sp. FC_14]|nr:hypothetical protein F5I97DRAFT_1806123 [Phlebopus sp. FC_14]
MVAGAPLESNRHQSQEHNQHHHQHRPSRRPQQQPEQYDLQESQKHTKNKQGYYKQTKTQKQPQQEQEVHDTWGVGGEWYDHHDEEVDYEATHDAWGRKVHFSPARTVPLEPPSVSSTVVENFTVNALPSNKLGLSAYPISRTLSYAYSGTATSFGSSGGRNTMPQIADVHFLESQGEALRCVRRAFYNKSRRAEERFHWLFPPEKDERVRMLLNWIQSGSFSIASFGLQKFLQTRERGALIVNAGYIPTNSMSEPVVDWITWDQIQPTMDRVLQESVGYYNPAVHIVIFVFLPSPSGNSLAIWRRKIPIPNSIRLAYQAQITQAIASLRKDYPVLIDQLPPPPPPPTPPEPPRKKRKWYKLWLST